jgi:2-methylcitrate dehydratase PrpD
MRSDRGGAEQVHDAGSNANGQGPGQDRDSLAVQPVSSEEQIKAPTRTLAAHAAATTFGDLSNRDATRLTRLIVEAVGCALGAQILEQGQMYVGYVRDQGCRPKSTVLGTSSMTSSALAAWANSGLINTLDFDDTLFGHPGATVVGTALAVAEARHATGRDLLTAVAVGYEVSLRVSEAIKASVGRWRQVTASSTAQTLGAVAAAAKLLGLDEDATEMAYGLAASMAPVPAIRKFGTQDCGRIAWTKNQYAAAALAGVTGAQLAARGAVGPEAVLDGDTGFWIMAGSDRFDPSALVDGLGDDWRFHQVAFKPYPCCRFFHPSIDALVELLKAENVRPDDVAVIRVNSVLHLQTFLNRRPVTPYDAEFSLPHALALTALRVRPGLDWFDEAHLRNTRVHELMDAVQVDVSEEAERAFALHRPYRTKVELGTRDGHRTQISVDAPLGHPVNPMTEEALDAKFLHLAGSAIGVGGAEHLLKTLSRLQDVDDVAELLPLLA